MSSNLDEGTPYLFGFVLHTFSFLVDSPGVFIKYHHALSLSKKDGFRWHCWRCAHRWQSWHCWHCWHFRKYWRRSWQSWHIHVLDNTDQVVIIMIRKSWRWSWPQIGDHDVHELLKTNPMLPAPILSRKGVIEHLERFVRIITGFNILFNILMSY